MTISKSAEVQGDLPPMLKMDDIMTQKGSTVSKYMYSISEQDGVQGYLFIS